MKASVLNGINDLAYVDIPVPTLKNGEVLVNVKACGICGSDVNRVFKTGTYHFPTVIGHEFSGVVVDYSKDNTENVKWIGKRVGVFPLKPCFKCINCKEGNYEMCTDYDYLGSRCNGGFEEYVAVPAWNLIELPENVTFEDAAMLEPTAVAIHALLQAPEIKNKSIAIIGPGTIGCILIHIAKYFGCGNVIMVGRSDDKLNYAAARGADHTINLMHENYIDAVRNITYGNGADIVIEGTGASQCLNIAIEIARSGGHIVLMGNPQDDMNLDKNTYWQILRRQLTLHGTWNSSFRSHKDDWKTAVTLISNGKISLSDMITHRLDFNCLLEGLKLMHNKCILTNKVMLFNNEK